MSAPGTVALQQLLLLGRLLVMCREHGDEDQQREIHAWMARTVGRVIALHAGAAPADALPRPAHIEAAGPPHMSWHGEIAAEGLATIERMLAVEDGVVLAFPRLLVWVGDDGGVRRVEPCLGQLAYAGRHVVMVESDADKHVFDLQGGAWQRGTVDPARWFGGPLLLPPDAQRPFEADYPPLRKVSPCARFRWDVEGPIVRLADGAPVTGDEPFGPHDEDVDPGRGRALCKPRELPSPGTTVTVLDGVTFTLRGASAITVRDTGEPAFARHPSGFRAFRSGGLYQGRKRVARLGMPAFQAAFHADGAVLWVLGADHLFRIAWDEAPRLDRAYLLEELAPLFADGGGHARVALVPHRPSAGAPKKGAVR